MKKAIVLTFTLLMVISVKGQKLVDSLYLHMYNYHIIKGELKEGLDLSNLSESYNIEEIIDTANTEAFSIFKFYHLEYEGPIISFLIIENDNVEIYDILSFDVLIEKILNVSSIDEKLKTLYIKEILRKLRKYFEGADMRRLVMRMDYGKYHYFIPVINLKNQEGSIIK